MLLFNIRILFSTETEGERKEKREKGEGEERKIAWVLIRLTQTKPFSREALGDYLKERLHREIVVCSHSSGSA